MNDLKNVVIIGSGPAALTAAIYNARADLEPLVLAGVKWGGQLMLTTDVENYPGFPEGILGPELMEKFREQAKRFGAEIIAEDVGSVDFKSKPFKIISGAKTYQAKAVIIATGADTKWLGLPNEQRLIGRGISSCAPCDAIFFILSSEVVDVLGKDKVEGVKIKSSKDGSIREMPIDGIFVAIGHLPITDIFKGQVQLDEKGYVKKVTNDKRLTTNAGPLFGYQMMTSVEGVFVAGDVHDYHYRQAVTAAGYGCQAALEVERWLEA